MKSNTYIIRQRLGKRLDDDVKKISKLRVANKIVRWWYEGSYLCYEVKK
jgi:hypothetical protein